MGYDAHANFASSTVAVAPNPADTGVSLVVKAGEGAKFTGVPPYNCTVQNPTGEKEIIRVTAVNGDAFTFSRIAELPGSAISIVVGATIVNSISAKVLTDIENSIKTYDVVNQAAHGFSVGQWVVPNANTFVLSMADGNTPLDGVGIITSITTDTFTMQRSGHVTGLTNLIPGMQYYISALVAGTIVGFKPLVNTQVIAPVFVAVDATSGNINIQRPSQADADPLVYGINIGGDQQSNQTYATTQNAADAAIITKHMPWKRVRISIPSYNSTQGIANMRALALYYQSLGYFTSYGVTALREPSGQTDSAYAAWLAQVPSEAAWAYANGINRFFIGNEEGNQAVIGAYGSLTPTKLINDVKAMAAALKASYPTGMEIVYSDAQSMIVQWGAAGLGSLDKFGFNVYDPNFTGFLDYALTISGGSLAAKLFISEWAANLPYKYQVTSGGFNDQTYAADLAARYQALRVRNLEGYFFALRYGGNGDATTDWNILKSDGTFKPGAREAFGGGTGSTYQGVLNSTVLHTTGAENASGIKKFLNGISLTNLFDINGLLSIVLVGVANAVNWIQITNAANNGAPTISAQGSNAYLPINYVTKGGAPHNHFGGPVWASNGLQVSTPYVPTSASDTGSKGDISWDANYVYVCVANNSWKRSAINAW